LEKTRVETPVSAASQMAPAPASSAIAMPLAEDIMIL
jgi:hypothetical protein